MPSDQSSETRAQRDWSELSEEAIIEQEPTRAQKLLYAVLIQSAF